MTLPSAASTPIATKAGQCGRQRRIRNRDTETGWVAVADCSVAAILDRAYICCRPAAIDSGSVVPAAVYVALRFLLAGPHLTSPRVRGRDGRPCGSFPFPFLGGYALDET